MPQTTNKFGPMSQSVQLDGSGNGQVSFQAQGSNIRITNLFVKVSTAVNQASAKIYKGFVADGNIISNTNSGSTGGAAHGAIDLFDGETCIVVWTGGDASATATATFVGYKLPFDENPTNTELTWDDPLAAGDGSLIYPALKSPNFVSGVSGWRVTRDGDAEFNDVVIRGELYVNGGSNSYIHIYTDAGLQPIVDLRPGDTTFTFDPGNVYASTGPGLDTGTLLLQAPIISSGGSGGQLIAWSAPSLSGYPAIAGIEVNPYLLVDGSLELNSGSFIYDSVVTAFTGNIPNNSVVTSFTPTSILTNNHSIYPGSGVDYTIQNSGTYEIGSLLRYNTSAAGQIQARLYKNGVDLVYKAEPFVSGTNPTAQITTIENLTAGDKIQFGTFQNSGGVLAVNYGRQWIKRIQV